MVKLAIRNTFSGGGSMASNFEFIKDKKLEYIKKACIEAEKGITIGTNVSAILSRKCLELAIKWIYGVDEELKIPYNQTLATLIYDKRFQTIIDEDLHYKIIYIQKLGNQAVHSKAIIKREDVMLSLKNLHDFMQWVTYLYCDDFEKHTFSESIVPSTKSSEELLIMEKEISNPSLSHKTRKEKILNNIFNLDRTIQEIQLQYKDSRKILSKKRKKKQSLTSSNSIEISEFKTRKQYIDLDLKIAGWEFKKTVIEELPIEGMPNKSGNGFVDYVLMGKNGKAIGLIEAKRTSKDPRDGKQQAKLYANCLEKKYGQRPIIFYSNGFDIYIWDDNSYPPRKISGYYTQEEIELLIERRNLKKDLKNILIKEEIIDRPYQQEAVKEFCNSLNHCERKGLLVMATGTGKTRVAISIVDILIKSDWVKNILFLSDRTQLVKQAKKSFNHFIKSLSTIDLTVEKENAENMRMVFSTYQTMMNAIDDVKTKNENRLFTSGHFDLIIIDEAHRSIYKKYQAIFEYFDGLLLGLTATPRSDIDKNTYSIFGLQNKNPTYFYEYQEAVKDGYLVDYHTVECSTRFIREGIKYNELSDEDKEEFEDTFAEDEEVNDKISSAAINEWLFNHNTIDKVLETVMEKGIKVESNDKLGKTIIFAKNHKHALEIEDRFNVLYPEYKGNFARVIDINTNYYESLIEDFSDSHKMPQIAISVDMLDTGVDIPEVVNLVFFKALKSKTKFLQMIGRGTRLCPNLFGFGKDKKEFYIFDTCQNFEFFEQNPKEIESTITLNLTQSIFNLKVDILRELEKKEYLNNQECIKYKNRLLQEVVDAIISLNTKKFYVKQRLKYVEKYRDIKNWQNLTDLAVKEIKDNLTFLVIPNDSDESTKQFDKLMMTIELSKLLNMKFQREINKLVKIGEELLKLMNLSQVANQKDNIDKIVQEGYIQRASIIEIERIRKSLRELIKVLKDRVKKEVYTDFNDNIDIVEHDDRQIEELEFSDYKKKVKFYLKNNLNNETINKIRNNKKITPNELKNLESNLYNNLNSNQNEFKSNFENESLILLIRRNLGLSKETVDKLFSERINEYELNKEQLRFINLIKSYMIKNGTFDKKILNQAPFTNYGTIPQLFEEQMDVIREIVRIIDLVNENGDYK